MTLHVTSVQELGPAGVGRAELLRYAAALGALSDDPVGRALVRADREEAGLPESAAEDEDDRPPLEVSGFAEHPGGGLEGLVRRAHAGLAPGGLLNTRRVLLGPPGWVAGQGVAVPAGTPDAGHTVAVAWDGAVRGVVTLRTAPGAGRPGPAT